MAITDNTTALRALLVKANALPDAGEGGITPSGTVQITTNGTHDVTEYANAYVNVPVGVFPSGTLSIDENGTHDVTNYASVTVNVAGSGGGDNTEIDGLITHEITQVVNSRITSVGTYVFRECYKLTRAILPNVTTVGNYAFYACYALADIDFPELTKIGNYSFYGCYPIVKADFPKVTQIGTYAFNSCKAMTALILRSPTVATLGNAAVFNGTPIKSGTGYIYVPSALVDSYKAASNWSTYAAQIRAIEDYPDITGG